MKNRFFAPIALGAALMVWSCQEAASPDTTQDELTPLMSMSGAPPPVGGPVFVSGDDADDFGHCSAPTACGTLYANLLDFAVQNSSTGGVGDILAIGPTGQALTALNNWESAAPNGPYSITVLTTTAQIASVTFADYKVLYIPSDGNTPGGITSTLLVALNARQSSIVNFVNNLGGGLLALTEAASGVNAYGWLPIPLTTAASFHTGAFPITPTAALLTLSPSTTTANLTHCCLHNVFTGPAGFSGLDVLAFHDHGGTSGFEFSTDHAVILGGAQVIISGTISLSPATSTNPTGTPHTVTALAQDGSPLVPAVGATVTFTVTGQNPQTGTATTDGSGSAGFTYTGSGGVGTDNIVAAFTDVAGNPQTSNIVQKTWTAANAPPTANAGPDQSPVPRTSAAGVSVALDGTLSSDPDTDPLTFSWTGPFPEGGGTVAGAEPTVSLSALGVNTITLTVDDGNGGTDTDDVDITVTNVTPTADAGPDQTVDLEGAAEALVTLDGSVSGDVDGTISFEWSTAALTTPATGETPTVSLPVGIHTITLKVTDNNGAFDEDVVIIEVRFVITAAAGGSAPIEEDDKKVGEVEVPAGALPVDAILVFEFVDGPCHEFLISQYGRCLSAKFVRKDDPSVEVIPTADLTYGMCLPLPLVAAGVTDPLIPFEFDNATSPVTPRQDFAGDLDCSEFVAAQPGNGLMRFARGLVDRVIQFFAPEPLVAAPVVFRGDGGRFWSGRSSFFVWANPTVNQPDGPKLLTGEEFDTNGVIRCKPKTVITVAVLTTDDSIDDFDATTIDASTVFFGRDGTEAREIHRDKRTGMFVDHVKLVDNDLLEDRVFHFRFEDTGLVCGEDTFARLSGVATDGRFVSADFVRLVEKGN